MILYVNGDSHSAGAEAVNPHCFAEDDYLYRSLGRIPHPDNIQVSYGCELANMLGAILHCDAESASSNERITRTIDEYIDENPKPDLVIIGWSTWEREEWLFDNTYFQVTASGTDSVPAALHEKYKAWVLEQGNTTRDIKMIQWHETIYKLHDWLDYKQVPHLFFNTYTDFSAIRKGHVQSGIECPAEFNWNGSYIEPYDSAYTYYNWLIANGFKTVRPDSYHFGPDGHRAWATFLYQNYVQKLLTS